MIYLECCKLDKERHAALKASEQAMEMHELLTQQVDRLRREKDLAYKQVSDLRRDNVKDKIRWVWPVVCVRGIKSPAVHLVGSAIAARCSTSTRRTGQMLASGTRGLVV